MLAVILMLVISSFGIMLSANAGNTYSVNVTVKNDSQQTVSNSQLVFDYSSWSGYNDQKYIIWLDPGQQTNLGSVPYYASCSVYVEDFYGNKISNEVSLTQYSSGSSITLTISGSSGGGTVGSVDPLIISSPTSYETVGADITVSGTCDASATGLEIYVTDTTGTESYIGDAQALFGSFSFSLTADTSGTYTIKLKAYGMINSLTKVYYGEASVTFLVSISSSSSSGSSGGTSGGTSGDGDQIDTQNVPPSVSIISPSGNEPIPVSGSFLNISVEAYDPDEDTISIVEYYIDNSKISSSDLSPSGSKYTSSASLDISSFANGVHYVKAEVHDDRGGIGSDIIQINITNSAGQNNNANLPELGIFILQPSDTSQNFSGVITISGDFTYPYDSVNYPSVYYSVDSENNKKVTGVNSGTGDGRGSFVFELNTSSFSDGIHNINVSIEYNGDFSDDNIFLFFDNPHPPWINVNTIFPKNTDGSTGTLRQKLTVMGQAGDDDGDAFRIFTRVYSTVQPPPWKEISGGTSWRTIIDPLKLTDGTYAFEAKVEAIDGVAYSGKYFFNVSNHVPPVIDISYPHMNDMVNMTVDIVGVATSSPVTEIANVWVAIDNGTMMPASIEKSTKSDNMVTWRYSLNTSSLPDGKYNITVTAADNLGGAGGVSTKKIIVRVDNPDPPIIVFRTPKNGDEVHINDTDPFVNLRAYTTPGTGNIVNVTIIVQGIDYYYPRDASPTKDWSSEWLVPLNLSRFNGPLMIKIVVTDAFNIETSKSISINVIKDTTPSDNNNNNDVQYLPRAYYDLYIKIKSLDMSVTDTSQSIQAGDQIKITGIIENNNLSYMAKNITVKYYEDEASGDPLYTYSVSVLGQNSDKNVVYNWTVDTVGDHRIIMHLYVDNIKTDEKSTDYINVALGRTSSGGFPMEWLILILALTAIVGSILYFRPRNRNILAKEQYSNDFYDSAFDVNNYDPYSTYSAGYGGYNQNPYDPYGNYNQYPPADQYNPFPPRQYNQYDQYPPQQYQQPSMQPVTGAKMKPIKKEK